ncbi:MAG: hypothetical protein WDW36_002293 [Sanguina aurantia]
MATVPSSAPDAAFRPLGETWHTPTGELPCSDPVGQRAARPSSVTSGAPALQANLQIGRDARSDLLALDLESATARVVAASVQPPLLLAMDSAMRMPEAAGAHTALQFELAALLARGIGGVQVNAPNGVVLAKAGTPIKPSMDAIPIDAPAGINNEIVWRGGLTLRTRLALHNGTGPAGELVVDQPLTLLQSRLQSGTYLDAAVTTLLCHPLTATKASCLRIGSGNPVPESIRISERFSALVSLAVAGSTGTARAEASEGVPTDVFAYGPVGSTGLALMVQLDATGLYAPIRRGMLWGMSTVLLVVLAAATWLRRRIRTLVRRLVTSESRYKAVVESLHDGLLLQDSGAKILASNPAARRILRMADAELRTRDSLDPAWKAVREDGSDWPGEDHPAPRTLRTGKPETGVIMGVPTPDGAMRWVSINTALAGGSGAGEERVGVGLLLPLLPLLLLPLPQGWMLRLG